MKKDETRFTIRFNQIDPRHQRAMNALRAAGRRKASLIADAVCEYWAMYEDGGAAVVMPLAPYQPFPHSDVMANAATNDLHKQSQKPLPGSLIHTRQEAETDEDIEDMPETDGESIDASSDNQPFDDDMREAVLSGLNAFRT